VSGCVSRWVSIVSKGILEVVALRVAGCKISLSSLHQHINIVLSLNVTFLAV
jgi:hypothetical protein